MEESNFDKVLGASFIFDNDKCPIAICDENGEISYQNQSWAQQTKSLKKVNLTQQILTIESFQSLNIPHWPQPEISETWQVQKLQDSNNNLKGFLIRGNHHLPENNDILEYHKMINASKDGLTLINRDYRYKLCNEAFTMNKDLHFGDILGKSISEVWGELTFQNYIKPNLDESFKGKTVNYQLWIQFSKTVRRYMDVTYWPYVENEKVTHVVVNSRDITDIKIVEMELKENLKKAEMAAAVKSQFLSNMSHEIRTPLNGIIGTLSLIDRNKLNEELQEFVNIIETSSSTLLRLVNDVLDHAKIEAGKMELDLIRFSPKKAIKEITELFNYLAHSKGITTTTTLDKSLPDELVGDPGRFKQVLSNLINNALKFTENGEVRVEVEVIEKEDNGLIPLRIKVKDTGKGIAPHTLNKLFQPFEQGDNSNRTYSGTGLGLHISKSLVEMMNGEIGVNSIEGQGSEFWFIVRFEEVVKVKSTKSNLKTLDEAHVLCYHRDISSLKVIKSHLQELKCQVIESDQEAELNLKQAPDFIFIHDLSVTGALSTKAFFQKQFPYAQFLYVSSKGFRGESKKAWDEGFKAYLTGDLNLSILENTLNILISDDSLDQIVTRYSTPDSSPQNLSFLICEDNTLNQRLLTTILNSMGHNNIDIAENGLKGLKAAKEKVYDIILMDLRMPELDGVEATKLIRKESKNQETFIVAITGDATTEAKEECLNAGMSDFLAKPFTKQQFMKFIQQLNSK